MGRGIGLRKIAPILEAFPDIVTSSESSETKIDKVKSVKGNEQKTAKTFVDNIPRFIEFLSNCGLESKLQEQKITKEEEKKPSIINGKKIVMTKIRDKQIIDNLGNYGAVLEDSMRKDTFVLIVKTKEDVSNKTKYAIENNIPIMTPDEFKSLYF
jgi:hypothetical protein